MMQAVELQEAVGLEAELELIEAQVRVGACHADIDQRLGGLVVGVDLAKSRLIPDPGVQFDHIAKVICAGACWASSPRALDPVPGLGQPGNNAFDMVSLHLNHSVLRGAAGAAGGT